ncbi:hypothetical protein LTR66_014148, partial [Elasticomyces elasticus]
MSLLQAGGPSPTHREGKSHTLSLASPVYMSEHESQSEKPVATALTAFEDARALVRLVQCPQCSRPFRSPVTLPCGRSLCRDCLPESYRRTTTYPDIPGRNRGIACPFSTCNQEHTVADCCIDVTLTKVMETIAETVTHHRPATEDTPTLLEEVVRWDEVLGSRETAEKPRTKILHGGRLVATYSLAEMGELNYKSDVVYQSMADTGDDYRQLDEHVLRQLCELAHKELD